MRRLIQLATSLFVLFAFIPYYSFAQTRTVRGTVSDQQNSPLVGVTVSVRGTTQATTTGNDGSYSIQATNNNTLIFSYVGHETQSIPVGTRSTIDVTLLEGKESLDEVVVTAEFGMKRIARAIGSSVQIVKATDITESGRDNFISALQGRVSGLNVINSSGAPGASTTVVLRSLTSISGNNQPLYVIDGIPMNNSTFDPVAATGDRFASRNQDFSSRGNDFNPEDIESMTVLKGAAAAALYGSDASNGAIIITTKKGRAGKGRITYSNSFRWDKPYGYPEVQTKYANGAYGTTNYYYTSRFGGLYPAGMKLYDNLSAVTQTGFSQRHNLSVEAGNERATIRAAAAIIDQTGVIKTTDYSRINLTISGQADVTKWMKFEGSMAYTKTGNNKALKGSEGPLYLASLWPIVDDMSTYMDADGSHMRYPNYYIDTDLLNPLFGLYKNKNYDKSDRFISNIATTFTPFAHSFLRAQIGWDVGMQTFVTSMHPYYSARNAGVGGYYLTNANFSDPTLNVLAGYNNNFFNNKFTFSGQVGYHQLENGITRLSNRGTKFIIPDFQSINNVDPATLVTSQVNTKRRIQAVSGQFEFGYNNLAFLTFRGRNDWSSTLPVANNSYFYPAVEGAFILTELKAFKKIPIINYLKLRGSVAQVGKDAGPLEIDPQLIVTGLTGGGFKYDFTGPNKNLKPEMTTSREFGFETRLLKNRVNADFTYFRTLSEDQIVKGFRLSYATGFVLNNMNVGTFKTWGWEAHVDGDIIKASNGLTWNLGVNASRTRSEIVSLPKNVSEYYNAYSWNSGNIRTGIMVGHPITTLTGRAYDRDTVRGEVLIDPTTGLPLVAPGWSVIGDREPKLRFGLMSSLSYAGFRLSALLAGRYGATVVNGTKRNMMLRGTSWESVDLRERQAVIFNGVLKDGKENTANPTKNTISVDYSTYGASIYTGGDEDWIERNVNYLRLQELRLGYRLPAKLLSKTKLISAVDVYIIGNDFFTWTNYSGIDAVGNTVGASAGGVGGEGYDVWSLPNPRGFTVGFSVTF